MRPTADRTSDPTPPPAAGASGKLVIIGILTIALAAAIVSWWFRYSTTHRALQFWTPTGAKLIRDAPVITLRQKPFASLAAFGSNSSAAQTNLDSSAIDISHAHGLAHLRNALLEDRNFNWPELADQEPDTIGVDLLRWMLTFNDPDTNKSMTIFFSDDCRLAARPGEKNLLHAISTEPIAAGLAEMFAEFSATPAAESAAPAR